MFPLGEATASSGFAVPYSRLAQPRLSGKGEVFFPQYLLIGIVDHPEERTQPAGNGSWSQLPSSVTHLKHLAILDTFRTIEARISIGSSREIAKKNALPSWKHPQL
jgi:hypothetical protein